MEQKDRSLPQRRRISAEEASELMRAADLEPLARYPGANERWPCRCRTCGKDVSPRLADVRRGTRCRFCGFKRRDTARTVTAEQATQEMEAAGLRPVESFPGRTSAWACECVRCGSRVTPSLAAVRRGHGCVVCGNRSSARTRTTPEAVAREEMRKAGLEPLDPFPGADEPWRCRCLTCGSEVRPRLHSIRSGQGGCKVCGVRRRAEGQRLSHQQASGVMVAADLEPLEDYPGSKERWRCRCTRCGTEVDARLDSVRAGSRSCETCALLSRRAALRTPHAEAVAVMRAAGLEPLEDYPGSGAPWRCRCLACGTEATRRLNGVRSGGHGCPRCAIRRRAAAQRLPGDEAEAVMLQAGLVPLEPYPGVIRRWSCQCARCDRPSTPTLADVRAGHGCRHCGVARRTDARRTPAAVAAAVMVKAGLEPLEPYQNANAPWRCRCMNCDAEVAPRLGTVRNGSGCGSCCAYGLRRDAPAQVYLITHPVLLAHKVGVTGLSTGQSRLRAHARHGWQVYRTLSTATGADALAIESTVLRYLRRDLGLPPLLTSVQMPQGGHTETVSADEIGLTQLWRLLTVVQAQDGRAGDGHAAKAT